MSIYDLLMGLSGMCFCPQCMGYGRPVAPSPFPPFGGGYAGFPGLPGGPTPFPGGFPGGFPGAGQPTIPGLNDPYGGFDPEDFEDDPDIYRPGFGGYPTAPQPGTAWPQPTNTWPQPTTTWPQPSTSLPPATQPAPATQRPPENFGGSNRDRPGGPIYNDDSIASVPRLPPPTVQRIQPKDPSQTFMHPQMLAGASRHPYNSEYPKSINQRPAPIESMTAEQQSAMAFVKTCLIIMPLNVVGEDMYDLYQKGKVPERLVQHMRYLLATIIPHLKEGGDVVPTDYPKIRRCLDWMAEIGEVFAGAPYWNYGFGKKGHARGTGWWRKERLGFPEGPGV